MNLVSNMLRTILLMVFISLGVAEAKEDIDQTLDVENDSIIEISHVSGEAKILGWDKKQVRVFGELGDKTDSFRFERDGKSVVIEIEVKKNKKAWGWNDDHGDGDDITIYVPHNSKIDYHSPNAELEIKDVYGGSYIDMINQELKASNLKGRIRIKTVNGDMKVKDLVGDVSLDSVNGDINAINIEGKEISFNTVNGDIDASSLAKEVSAETVNGDIEITLGDVSDLNTSTVNGSIDIDLNLIDGGKLKASSVGGSINLGFQENIQAKFVIEAHAGGSIKNRITNEKANKAKYGPRTWLEFSSGKPTARIDISTVHGRIDVKNRD